MTRTTDFLVVGAGVIGLRLALETKRRHPDATVTVLEKEERPGLHASGRNSGVLHAGFYYASDSLKAEFTREGNRRLTEYCRRRDLPLNPCGKLVVTRDASELEGLDLLLERGRRNGVELEEVTAGEAREIEPRVKTHRKALWSPATATVDPSAIMAAFAEDARREGVEILTGTEYLGRRGDGDASRGFPGRASRSAGPGDASRGFPERASRHTGSERREPPEAEPPADGALEVETDRGPIACGYLINAAGLHADRVARDFGFSRRYRILPFKGLYLHSDEPAGAIRTNIYPVPDVEKPFLGVHFTVTVDGRATVGPTATPAFWREHYRGFENFDPAEMLRIVGREALLFLKDEFGFRRLAWEELRKYRRSRMVELASRLARGVEASDYTEWGEPGIRAQLLDVEDWELVMDFRVEGDRRSFHVLNAVSPGFTCSIPFAEHCLDEIEERIG